MPRIYASDNDAMDFCIHCYPKEELAIEKYGNIGNHPDDPERGNCFGYDCEHPDYEIEGYHCCMCGDLLLEIDN